MGIKGWGELSIFCSIYIHSLDLTASAFSAYVGLRYAEVQKRKKGLRIGDERTEVLISVS